MLPGFLRKRRSKQAGIEPALDDVALLEVRAITITIRLACKPCYWSRTLI